MRTDLHLHSDFSLDGEFSPEELAKICSRHGVTRASLTDHNCVRGTRRFMEAARQEGIQAVAGTELDCICREVDLHLLGYGVDVHDVRYREAEEEILEQKRETSRERVRILREMGIRFEESRVWQLARDGIVTGEMIAEAALADERNRNLSLLEPYRPGGARAENPYVNFFWDFCSQGKAAFLPIRYPSFEKACRLIRETGGAAVIAHPANTVGRREELIQYMAQQGAEGLEVFSSYHNSGDIQYYRKLAKQYGLVMTAGSDFHGKTKPSVQPGLLKAMEEEDRFNLENWLNSRFPDGVGA